MQALVIPIDTPPGLPGRQRQVALLEAQHGSPMPSDLVAILLARREPWGVGRPGLFHAAIIHREDILPGQDQVEIETDGGSIRFDTDGGAATRRLAPAALLAALALVAVVTVAFSGLKAMEKPAGPRVVATQPGKARLRIQQRNADLVRDLIAAREAFSGGEGMKSIDWRPTGMVVEVSRSDATAATGDGRAFEKLPAAKGSDVDRWRLGPIAQRRAADGK